MPHRRRGSGYGRSDSSESSAGSSPSYTREIDCSAACALGRERKRYGRTLDANLSIVTPSVYDGAPLGSTGNRGPSRSEEVRCAFALWETADLAFATAPGPWDGSWGSWRFSLKGGKIFLWSRGTCVQVRRVSDIYHSPWYRASARSRLTLAARAKAVAEGLVSLANAGTVRIVKEFRGAEYSVLFDAPLPVTGKGKTPWAKVVRPGTSWWLDCCVATDDDMGPSHIDGEMLVPHCVDWVGSGCSTGDMPTTVSGSYHFRERISDDDWVAAKVLNANEVECIGVPVYVMRSDLFYTGKRRICVLEHDVAFDIAHGAKYLVVGQNRGIFFLEESLKDPRLLFKQLISTHLRADGRTMVCHNDLSSRMNRLLWQHVSSQGGKATLDICEAAECLGVDVGAAVIALSSGNYTSPIAVEQQRAFDMMFRGDGPGPLLHVSVRTADLICRTSMCLSGERMQSIKSGEVAVFESTEDGVWTGIGPPIDPLRERGDSGGGLASTALHADLPVVTPVLGLAARVWP